MVQQSQDLLRLTHTLTLDRISLCPFKRLAPKVLSYVMSTLGTLPRSQSPLFAEQAPTCS